MRILASFSNRISEVCKDKYFTIENATKAQGYRYSSTLSLLSALDGVSYQRYSPASLSP
jgi:hypothetical protein